MGARGSENGLIVASRHSALANNRARHNSHSSPIYPRCEAVPLRPRIRGVLIDGHRYCALNQQGKIEPVYFDDLA